MGVNWQVSPGAERVELTGGRGEVTFTVTNPGPVDARATLQVEGSEKTEPSWFEVAEPQQMVRYGAFTSFTVRVKPGAAPKGSHWLAARVYTADSSLEDSVLSDRVSFETSDDGGGGGNWWLWLILAVLVAAVVGVVLFLVLGNATATVPDVVGKSAADAERLILAAELEPVAEEKHHPSVPAGIVASQHPAGGTELDAGEPAGFVVSQGPAKVAIPRLAGEDVATARRTLEDLGLAVRVDRDGSPSVPLDHVIRTEPADGTAVEVGATVTLVVSDTPPVVTVPKVVDTHVKAAARTLRDAGLRMQLTGGGGLTVRSQDPEPGARVGQGTTISVCTSPFGALCGPGHK